MMQKQGLRAGARDCLRVVHPSEVGGLSFPTGVSKRQTIVGLLTIGEKLADVLNSKGIIPLPCTIS
jgi:hypothetical protein